METSILFGGCPPYSVRGQPRSTSSQVGYAGVVLPDLTSADRLRTDKAFSQITYKL